MNELEGHKCKVRVWSGFRSHTCDKRAKVKDNEEYFCGIHNPIKKREKERIQNEKWDQESKNREYRFAAEQYCKRNKLSLKELSEVKG